MRLNYLILGIVLALAAVPAACKKASQATDGDLDTVENLTKGANSKEALALNPLCGDSKGGQSWFSGNENVEFEGAFSSAQKTRLLEAAIRAMSGVPANIKNMFEQFKIKVVITDEVQPSACGGSTDDSFNSMFSDAAMHACYGVDAKDDNRPAIYLGQISQSDWPKLRAKYPALAKESVRDEYIVRHELVRTAGLIYAREIRLLAERALDEANLSDQERQQIEDGLAPYYQRRKMLDEAFAKDLGKDSAAKKRVAEIRSAVSDDAGEQHFIDYIVAEVFDSYFCNSSTKKSLEVGMPETYEVFDKTFYGAEL